MKLKILTALLLAIGLTLVACGGGNNAPAKGGENKGGECAPANDSAENSGETGEESPAKAMVYEVGIDGMT